jgi:esterase/lipase superfamily enzyme
MKARDAPHPVLDQIVLIAADIDAAQFKNLAQRFRPTAHRFTLYASSKDEALKLSEIYAGCGQENR